jgi:hypothetical protein
MSWVLIKYISMAENGRLLGVIVDACICDRSKCLALPAVGGKSDEGLVTEIEGRYKVEGCSPEVAEVAYVGEKGALLDRETGKLDPVSLWRAEFLRAEHQGKPKSTLPPRPCKAGVN